ncbi:hypothetical protein Droror1_Dr00001684 [Drosera rotundifolia]
MYPPAKAMVDEYMLCQPPNPPITLFPFPSPTNTNNGPHFANPQMPNLSTFIISSPNPHQNHVRFIITKNIISSVVVQNPRNKTILMDQPIPTNQPKKKKKKTIAASI